MAISISILPTDKLRIISNYSITDFNYTNLVQLYQPFIGAEASALYMTLVSRLQKLPFEQLPSFTYEELLLNLNLNMHTFLQVCNRLEAIGLIKTFYSEKGKSKDFVYQLLPPLTAPQFFKNQLLSSLLLEYIGENKFRKLEEHLLQKLPTQQYKENTHEFLEVFQKPMHQTQELTSVSSEKEPHISGTLDIQLLKELLGKTFINLNDVEGHLKDVQALATLYGLDEIQIVKLLEDAMDIEHDCINWKRLQFLASEQYQFQPINPTTSLNDESPLTLSQETSSKKLSPFEKQIVEACQSYTPLEFLAELKAEEGTGESITIEERSTLINAVKNPKVKLPVINFLIHYMLVDQEMSSLNRNFFEKTLNDWLRHHISDPLSAMDYIRKRQTKEYKHSSYSKIKNAPFKEKLPAWAEKQKQNSTAVQTKTKLSVAESQKINDDIQRLMKKLEK